MSNRQTKPLSHLSCVFFSEWIMVYKDDHSMTMIGFVDWLSLFQAFSFLFRLFGGAFCIYCVYFGVPFSWGTISKTIIKISIASGFHQIMQLDQPTNLHIKIYSRGEMSTLPKSLYNLQHLQSGIFCEGDFKGQNATFCTDFHLQ